MVLLKISEPDTCPAPSNQNAVIGIDLGTTHSLVAVVRNNVPEVLCDHHGRALLPSVVRYFKNGEVIVGYTDIAEEPSDPCNTIVSVKRLMGRSLSEAKSYNTVHNFIEGDTQVRLQTFRGNLRPEEVSAQILLTLKRRAQSILNKDILGAVITVPAYFDDSQRQATYTAAQLAGLNILRLINEPTAAAIAYGLDRSPEGVYAVYDIGGGTFDISILRFSKGIFEVIATGGDTELGGNDFDLAIANTIVSSLSLENISGNDWRNLLNSARTMRESLSKHDKTSLNISFENGKEIEWPCTRAQCEEIVKPLVERTLTCVRQALRDAHYSCKQICGVIMVGGVTRMPLIRRTVEGLFGSKLLTDIDPDQLVALGAALQASLLAGNHIPGKDWLLLDVVPLSLGVETIGGLVEVIIPRNSSIPIAKAQEFTTFKDGQSSMSIHVLQGERKLVKDCRSLAKFELSGIPRMVAGAARIRVTFQVDADGLLSVDAHEKSTGISAKVSVKPSYGLTEKEVQRMLLDGISGTKTDTHVYILGEQKAKIKQMISFVKKGLETDGDLLDKAERNRVEQKLASAISLQDSEDLNIVYIAAQELALVTKNFAVRRMDRNINTDLAYQKTAVTKKT